MTPEELYNQAYKYLEEQDSASALSCLIQAANAKFVDAIVCLGDAYYERYNEDDWGVEVDYQQALFYYEQAATLGSIDAMRYAADIYSGLHYCDDKLINFEKTLSYYQQASMLGDPDASYQLFFIYQDGLCDQKIDLEKAEQYERLAIVQGNDTAQNNFCDKLIDKMDLGILLTEEEKKYFLEKTRDLSFPQVHPNFRKRKITSDLTNAKSNFDDFIQLLTKKFGPGERLVAYQIAKLNEDFSVHTGQPLELKNIASLYQKAAEEGSIDAIYYFITNQEACNIIGLTRKTFRGWILAISKPLPYLNHVTFSTFRDNFLLAALHAQGKYGLKKSLNACQLLFCDITTHVTVVFKKFEHNMDSLGTCSQAWIPYDQWNTQLVRDLVDGLIYFATDKDFSSFFDKEKALKPAFMSVLSYFSKICEAQLGQQNNKTLNARFGYILEKFAFIFKAELQDIAEYAEWKELHIQATVGNDGNSFVKIMNRPTMSLTNSHFNFMPPPLQLTTTSSTQTFVQKREREEKAMKDDKIMPDEKTPKLYK